MKTNPDRKTIEKSAWAKGFKKESPRCYEQAIGFSLTPQLPVNLFWNTDAGILQCAIVPVSDPGFWLDATLDAKTAVELCREMGWVIRSRNTRESVVSYMRSMYGGGGYDKSGNAKK